ncbi:MAG TPA: hypothetical protein VNT75_10295 [Symbiobacteriaceae bacterium]|nr:hypothetical protein [Symbiobacteriaceae bacterium]
MATQGRSDEDVREEGIYLCADGCERRYYREGERFLTCAVATETTTWTKIEEI